ncbi:MAG: STAS domain-containing protein [Candidatus Firestonebacteria bacterium]|nr:STAS domain-containing protein [Candidatus Firestonebacteria bacterium]
MIGDDLKIFQQKLDSLFELKIKNVIIDLAKVSVMDSIGIEIIDEAIQNGLNIKLVHFPDQMLNYFYHAKITQGLNLFSTERTAINSFLNTSSSQNEKRQYPRIQANLPAAIIFKTNENDIIYPNAFTQNISTKGAWIEYSDVSEIYDFKSLFSLGLREKNILDLFLDTTNYKSLQNTSSDKKDGIQIECDLQRLYQGPLNLGVGLKFKEELKHMHFLAILP